LTSDGTPVAEERQKVSSKNILVQMAYVITGGNEIGLWPEKMREYWFKNETDSL